MDNNNWTDELINDADANFLYNDIQFSSEFYNNLSEISNGIPEQTQQADVDVVYESLEPNEIQFRQAPENNISSSSLASTASSSSTNNIRVKNNFRQCAKAVKGWVLNGPRTNLPNTPEALFPAFGVAFMKARTMKTSRKGRPKEDGRGSPYHRENYEIKRRCQKFISSFIKKYENRGIKEIKLEELEEYPNEIEKRGPSSSRK